MSGLVAGPGTGGFHGRLGNVTLFEEEEGGKKDLSQFYH